MEDSWLLSIPKLLNANTPTLEIKETNIQRELSNVIDEICFVSSNNMAIGRV